MTAKQVHEALRTGNVPESAVVRQLARDAADSRELTAELFQHLVEPLSDSFAPEACQQYTAVFSEIIAELAPDLDASQLRARYKRMTTARPGTLAYPKKVFVLSRVTIGADIAVTSVIMDAAKRAFPRAEIIFTGSAKNAELWAGDKRIGFLEAPYERTGTLRGRIEAFRALTQLLAQPASIVVDPDSRLTQLGLIPVCPDDRYFFFESRSFGASTVHPISVLASEWASQEFGASGSRPYLALPPAESEPRVTVSFGVGENSAKRVSEAFEIGMLQDLVSCGAKVLVDQGAGGEEAERVRLAVDQTAGLPDQVKMFEGPFAAFAARIARSPLYIGYDSAGQHAAAALGVPSITVFAGYPNDRFLQRWHPSGPGGQNQTLLSSDPQLLERIAARIREYAPAASR